DNIFCKLHKINYKSNSAYVNLVTAPSKFTLDLYNENNLYDNVTNKLVYNAIDVDLDEHKKLVEEKLKRRNLNIKSVFLGSLELHKGVKFLIDTFIKIKNNNIELIICGDGSLKEYVKEACNKDNRITYKGKVDKKEKLYILKESDVMIVPSIWYEPFGRVVIEGYKYAMPVIACEIGGIKELLNDEVSIGIKANSKKDLEVAINKLSNRNEIDNYLSNTIKFIKKYDLKEQISSFDNIYKKIVKKN
ncbi:glycosyltransferase, partial [Clostridium baratii]|uniref:glycosyltransferase n=1 Tax=Clostridium baratii TaxID=1561 RepID=UPI00374F819F